ncbi:hypothetical protein V6N12_076317 [Hibiscus sabdariffa]|uniref:Uncharacterized protein n=1 Tax=Hibiscus sabdariffa TaxID=183260 RepID=A0ABR2D9G4_9ROSI
MMKLTMVSLSNSPLFPRRMTKEFLEKYADEITFHFVFPVPIEAGISAGTSFYCLGRFWVFGLDCISSALLCFDLLLLSYVVYLILNLPRANRHLSHPQTRAIACPRTVLKSTLKPFTMNRSNPSFVFSIAFAILASVLLDFKMHCTAPLHPAINKLTQANWSDLVKSAAMADSAWVTEVQGVQHQQTCQQRLMGYLPGLFCQQSKMSSPDRLMGSVWPSFADGSTAGAATGAGVVLRSYRMCSGGVSVAEAGDGDCVAGGLDGVNGVDAKLAGASGV